jgi:chaperone modulatory protein CbpM
MKHVITGVIVEKSHALTLDEFAHATKAQKELIIEMVEYQLIQPEGKTPKEWRFDSVSLRRGRIASSFYRDLEVNMPGVALALDLMDRIDDMQRKIELLEKTFK